MPLNKQSGNMYGFISHTWNAIKGRCSHNCSYCYMRNFWKSETHLDEKEFKTDLGRNNFIFVGSSTDMFAEDIPRMWIERVIRYCKDYPENTYLFQTKNPLRFIKLRDMLISMNCILGVTMETNKEEWIHDFSRATPIHKRSDAMTIKGFRKMVTIEPIMDFNLNRFVNEIRRIQPEFVNIGADSKGHNLPEPSAEKIGQLIKELEKFTKVNLKDNLKRIYSEEVKEE